jgi:hypothetical protein
MKSARVWIALAALVGAAVGGLAPRVRAQTVGEPIRLSAWAVNMSNIATGANAVMDIRVDRWSTERERDELIATFLERGQDRLLDKLRDAPIKGRMNIPSWIGPDPNQVRLGWDLRFAMRTAAEDGGTRILLATDRYMTFAEVRNRPRIYDYPFTFLEIHLASDGTGEGKMAVATQLQFDKKQKAIIFENYSSEPVRLTNVKLEKYLAK